MTAFRPSPLLGVICPHMGGAGLMVDHRQSRHHLEPGRSVDTMLNELVLAGLLLAVVLLSGKI
jgi:hypothetical protein